MTTPRKSVTRLYAVLLIFLVLSAISEFGFLIWHWVVRGWPGENPDSIVFGQSVKTWGRIGKLTQFASGLAALIDLVGEKTVDSVAQTLETRSDRAKRMAAPSLVRARSVSMSTGEAAESVEEVFEGTAGVAIFAVHSKFVYGWVCTSLAWCLSAWL